MVAVIIAYKSKTIAEKALAALNEKGFDDRQARILGGATDTLVKELSEHGFDEGDARAYARAVEGGKAVVVADVPEGKTDQVQSIMERFTSDQGDADTSGDDVVSIVEEKFSVRKAKTVNGGVRVTSSVSETPVQETVTLTTETVSAERRPADRALKGDEADAAFVEKAVEMMGTREEAEVRKEARVVGEVVISKESRDRQKRVEDTVRKTDVNVERIGATDKN